MLAPSLHQFFRRHVQHAFHERGLAEPGVVDYVADVLTRFAHTPSLYAVRDSAGVPLERIAQMLVESRRAQGLDGNRPDRSRHAFILQHMGEYTMFMSGLFRQRLESRGELNYYLEHGRSAYWASADFEANAGRARVFRRLYFKLDQVSDALDHVQRVQLPLARETHPVTAFWRR